MARSSAGIRAPSEAVSHWNAIGPSDNGERDLRPAALHSRARPQARRAPE
jgi:hypothetical protein